MSTARSAVLGLLALTAPLTAAACGGDAEAGASAAEEAIAAAATVRPDPGGGPALLQLTEESVARLGLRTEEVTAVGDALSIPYAAVIYAPDGTSWAFVEVDDDVFQRRPITVDAIEGDVVRLSDGPDPGTAVVTVAAAELVGVEAGISGGE